MMQEREEYDEHGEMEEYDVHGEEKEERGDY